MNKVAIKKPGNSTWVGIVVPVGSRDEDDHIKGISHFTEHMLFKGTETRTKDQIKLEMDKYGANLNAFTSEEQTCYWVQIDNKYKNFAVDLLTDMVTNPIFPAVEINKEREVVLQELQMYEDNPQYHIWELTNQSIYPKISGLNLPIIGTRESLQNITRGEFFKFHHKHYIDPTMVIVGDVDVERTLPIITSKRFSREQVHTPSDVVFKREGINQACMTVSGVVPLASGISSNDHFNLELMKALCNAFSGRIFDTVREKNNLVYSTYFTYELFNCGTITWSVFAGLDPKNINKAHNLISQELSRPFSRSEIEFAVKKKTGSISLDIDSVKTYGRKIVSSLNQRIEYTSVCNNYSTYLNNAGFAINEFQKVMNFTNNKLVAIVPK